MREWRNMVHAARGRVTAVPKKSGFDILSGLPEEIRAAFREWTPEQQAHKQRLAAMGENGEEGSPRYEEELEALLESMLGPGWRGRHVRALVMDEGYFLTGPDARR